MPLMPDPETPTNPQHVLPEGKYLILGPSDSFGEDSSGSPTWLTIEMDETGKARPVFKTLKYQNPNALWVFKEGRLLITSSNSVSTPASDYALTLNKGQVTLETASVVKIPIRIHHRGTEAQRATKGRKKEANFLFFG
jgi:hypothetical protein